MPVIVSEHATRRYTPYGNSRGVRHRGPRALARYGPRVTAARARKRRAAKNAFVRVPRTKLAFPSGMRTKLRFCMRHTLNVAAADNITKVSFLANSLTDPFVGGVNHQPRGFDEFMEVYRTYTVLGSKISVNFMYQGYDGPSELDNDTSSFLIKNFHEESNGANAAACPPLMVGIHKGVTDIVVQTASQVMEQDRTVWKAMTPQNGSMTLSTGMTTADFFGKDALVGAEGYTGSIGADVDNKIFYVVWAGRANGVTQGEARAIAYVTIEYDCMFTEPKTLGES